MALEIKLPDQIFAHGWILNKDLGKMSKSSGEQIKPLDLLNKVGLDPANQFCTVRKRTPRTAPQTDNEKKHQVDSDQNLRRIPVALDNRARKRAGTQ